MVNWYLVEADGGLVAIDAGLPGFRDALARDLAAIGRRPADANAVILTHSDGDHTGLATTLREAGARILIHAGDDETLRRPGPKSGDASPAHLVPQLWRPALWRFLGHMGRRGGAKPRPIEDAETFGDGDVLDVPGAPRVIHTPGHTAGHSALLFEAARTLFVGDAVCTRNPLTGREGPQVMPTVFNVSTDRCFESLGSLEGLEANLLLAGHGAPWHGRPAVAAARAREAGRS